MTPKDFERTAVGGLTPTATTRKHRRAHTRTWEQARRELTAQADAAAKALAAEDKAAAAAAAKARTPKGGYHEPTSGRSWREFKLRPHKATTATLAGAYPFLAGRGLGAQGAYIGDDSYSGAAFCFDAHELYVRQIVSNTNILCAGNIGWGKSTTVKALAKRSMAFGRRVFVPGDPKDEWRALARVVRRPVHPTGPRPVHPPQPPRRRRETPRPDRHRLGQDPARPPPRPAANPGGDRIPETGAAGPGGRSRAEPGPGHLGAAVRGPDVVGCGA